jgi:hypothetical protein
LTPRKSVVTIPAVPNDGSTAPLAKYRTIANAVRVFPDFDTVAWPPTRSLPSGCTSTAAALLVAVEMSVMTFPPVPKETSRWPARS